MIGAFAPAVKTADELRLPLDKWLIVIEVFRTNVETEIDARMVLGCLNEEFTQCEFNFDLQDVDHILRVKTTENICNEQLILLLKNLGFQAEVLPDTLISVDVLFDDEIPGVAFETNALNTDQSTKEQHEGR